MKQSDSFLRDFGEAPGTGLKTESVSGKTLHKFVILHTSPDFVQTLLSRLCVFFVED